MKSSHSNQNNNNMTDAADICETAVNPMAPSRAGTSVLGTYVKIAGSLVEVRVSACSALLFCRILRIILLAKRGVEVGVGVAKEVRIELVVGKARPRSSVGATVDEKDVRVVLVDLVGVLEFEVEDEADDERRLEVVASAARLCCCSASSFNAGFIATVRPLPHR